MESTHVISVIAEAIEVAGDIIKTVAIEPTREEALARAAQARDADSVETGAGRGERRDRKGRPRPPEEFITLLSEEVMRHERYTVILEPDEEDPHRSNVRVPALPGCLTDGESIDDAMANAVKAIHGYVA